MNQGSIYRLEYIFLLRVGMFNIKHALLKLNDNSKYHNSSNQWHPVFDATLHQANHLQNDQVI